MSTQSVIHKTSSDILNDIDSFYIKESDKYLYEINYDIVQNINLNKIVMISLVENILLSNICLNTERLEERIKTILI